MAALRRPTLILLSLAALGAAGMFFGPDGWLGIEIVAVGAAALCAPMLVVAWIAVGRIPRTQNIEGIEADERDLQIHHSAQRAACGLMSATVIGLAALPEIFIAQAWMRPLIVGNVTLGSLIARTLTKSVYLVARHSRKCR